MYKGLLHRWKESEPLVRFLLLIPLSISVFVVFSILHNLIYALFILIFGEGFWETSGIGDEPVFFLIAVLGAPALFITGIVGTLYHLLNKLLGKKPKEQEDS